MLQDMSDSIDFAAEPAGCRRNLASDASVAFNAVEQGLSRCAITQDDGWCWPESLRFGFDRVVCAMFAVDAAVGSRAAGLREGPAKVHAAAAGRHAPVLIYSNSNSNSNMLFNTLNLIFLNVTMPN